MFVILRSSEHCLPVCLCWPLSSLVIVPTLPAHRPLSSMKGVLSSYHVMFITHRLKSVYSSIMNCFSAFDKWVQSELESCKIRILASLISLLLFTCSDSMRPANSRQYCLEKCCECSLYPHPMSSYCLLLGTRVPQNFRIFPCRQNQTQHNKYY